MKRLITILLIGVSFQSFSQKEQSNRKLFKVAQKHFSEKAYTESIDLLYKIDTAYTLKHPKVNYYRLRSFLEMGNIHEAYEILSSTREVKVPRKMTGLGAVKKQIEGKIRAYDSLVTLAKKNFSDNYVNTAISKINRAIAIDSFYFQAYVLRSELYYENIEFEKAIEDCNRLTSRIKNIPEVYLRRGLANYHRGRKEKALPDFTKSISLKPSAKAYYYRAKTTCQTSNTDCSDCPIKDLDSAIALQRDYRRALTLRGDLYVSKNQYEKAIVDFNTVLKKEPDDLDVLFKRAECHVQLNHDSEAEADYKRITEMSAYLPTAFFRKGFYSAKRNYHPDSLKSAISYYNRAITLDSSVSFYYYYRAISKKMRSNYSGAIKDLDKAIRLEPVNFDYYNDRNTCHYLKRSSYRKRKQDLQEGIRNFKAHETDSLTKHYHISKTYRLLFNFLSEDSYLDQSLNHLDNALEFDEGNVAIHYEKGLLYKLGLKDYSKAIKSFQKAISIDARHLQSHLNLAWCLNFNNQFSASYKAFLEAEKYFPNNAQVQQGLNALKRKIN
ncbi:MAG: tetratricopeptide repeat protein [Mesonia sp.]|uniref:tetratricopeptide repeat protein n=1 Tax=Mesonia sp. TaxID=1960830 RepID=UPI003F95AE76